MRKKAIKNDYDEIKGVLIARGTNLSRWARQHHFPLTTVYLAASGQRSGIKSIKIRTKLEEFLNA